MILKSSEEAFHLQKAIDALIQNGDVLKPVEEVTLKLVILQQITSQLTVSDGLTAGELLDYQVFGRAVLLQIL